MYSSIQAGPSTSARNEPTTFNKYNPISVNEYCMSLYQQVGSSTFLGQRFEGLYSYDHYPQPSSTPPSYHPLPPPSYSRQYNYDQDSQSFSPQRPYPTLYDDQPMSNPFHNNPYPYGQYNYEQHDSFITPQPSQPSPHVGDFCTPPNTWACAPNSEEDALIEDSGEDAEDMEVSSDDESDKSGNYQIDFDIITKPRCVGRSPFSKTVVLVQARRYPQRVTKHLPCCGTQQKLHVPHHGNH